MCERTHIGGALHVVVATENIGAAAGNAHVAERQLQGAIGARVVVADGVLGAAHAPDKGAGAIVGHGLGGGKNLPFRHAGDALDFSRVPFLDFLHDVVHAIDALADKFLVVPVVLKNMPHHAPDDGDVGNIKMA